MKEQKKPSSPNGFTLIELLTVIAIIGILASILIPVVGKVRENVRRSVCQSNIRQQLVAMHLFAEDRAGQPLSPDAPSRNAIPGFWHVLEATNDNAPLDLYPEYTNDYEIFICPSTRNVIRPQERDRQGRLRDLFTNAVDREDDRGGHSYEYLGIFGTAGPDGARPDLVGKAKTPNTVAGMETFIVLAFDGNDTVPNNCPDPRSNHGVDGWNWGFADGHVEWVTRERTNEYSLRSFHSRNNCPN